MKIFCISGKAGNGKDTFANILKEEFEKHNKKALIVHYADLVKYVAKTFFNWNGEKNEKGRTLLQYIGTDIVRKQNSNYWVNFILDMLNFFGNNWDYVLIPDARFPNEVDLMKKKYDTTLIRVERINYNTILSKEQQEHQSEVALDNFKPDYIIVNDTLDSLQNQACQLCANLINEGNLKVIDA